MEKAYDTLQDTFDETRETYLEQNPGMEMAEGEKKAFDELKSSNRHALISQSHDIVQMGNILKKGKIHKPIMATAQRLQSEEDNDLAERYACAIKSQKLLLERILDLYQPQNCKQLKNYQKLPMQSKCKQLKHEITCKIVKLN